MSWSKAGQWWRPTGRWSVTTLDFLNAVAPIAVNAQNGIQIFNDPFTAFLAAVQRSKTEKVEAEEHRRVGPSQPDPAPPHKRANKETDQNL